MKGRTGLEGTLLQVPVGRVDDLVSREKHPHSHTAFSFLHFSRAAPAGNCRASELIHSANIY